MTVATLIQDARTYVKTLTGNSDDVLRAAQINLALVAPGPSVLQYAAVPLPATPPSSISLTLPTLDTVVLDLPPEPGAALVFQDISAINAGTVPTLAATPPVIILPTTPSQLAAFTAALPPINTNIAFPDPPSALINPLIDAPVLVDRVEPARPQTLLPGFNAVAPTDSTVAPNDLAGTFDAAYRNAAPSTITMVNGYVDAMLAKYNPRYAEQMARIENQLATYLAGGTGLAPAVENAIYERARGKLNAEARRTRDAAYTDAAARGFTLPTGALASAVQQARQGAADNNAAAGREIVVMQAEMEQKNLQFAVTTSANLRQTMLSASLNYMQNLVSINGQALDYAKSILGAVVEAYNISVKAFGLRLDVYRAEAAVFETRLKSALAGIELYKIEVDALVALASVDRVKVDIYRARVDTLTVYANVYRAQIEAVQGRANLERLKIDLFKSQVEAFGAQVQSKNSEYQGYRAAIDGQTAIAQIFNTQVQGYAAQITGYKAGVEAQTEVVKAQALTNDARARQYTAVFTGYQTVVQARGEVARTKLENTRQGVIAFQATVQAQVANAQVAVEYYKAASTIGIENAKLKLATVVEDANIRQSFLKTSTDLSLHNAQIQATLASAAMSGMNTLATELKYE